MSFPIDNRERHIIPRWRDSGTTAALGELDSLGVSAQQSLLDQALFDEKVQEWTENHGISFAGDLLATAISVGSSHPEVMEAADYILASDHASEIARTVARRVLGESFDSQNVLEREPVASPLEPATHRARIRVFKQRLRVSPRNVLARADLALEYTALGSVKHALDQIDIALRLAPDNRFLLRSASRLLVHVGELDRALDIIRRTDRSNYDPWLVAVEVSLSGITKSRTVLAKTGLKLLGSKHFSDFHSTELASSLGTLEAESGARKKSRKLFHQSLVSPTENAVAQATWAAQNLGLGQFESNSLDTPGSFEARALSDLRAGHFENATRYSWRWLNDQTFSKTAAAFGSYVSAIAMGDYVQAIRFAKAGATANPGAWLLRNNLAFSLASTDEIDEATTVLGGIREDPMDATQRATLLATRGLILFRKGQLAAGRDFYRKAIDAFSRSSLPKSAALGAVCMAREEVNARSLEATKALEMARELMKNVDDPEIIAARNRVEREYELQQGTAAEPAAAPSPLPE